MKKAFDDLIRKRWEERDFPVDAQHRQEMATLLDSRKRRKLIPFWWWGGGFILVASGFFLLSQTHWFNHLAPAEKPVDQTSSVPMAEKPLQPDAVNPSAQAEPTPAVPSTPTPNQVQAKVSNTSPQHATEKVKSSKATVRDQTSSGKSQGFASIESSEQESKPSQAGFAESIPSVLSEGTIPLESKGIISTPSEPASNIVDSEKNKTEVTPVGVSEMAATSLRQDYITEELDVLSFGRISYSQQNEIGAITPAHRMRHHVYAFGETGMGVVFGSRPDYASGIKLNIGGGLGYNLLLKLHVSLAAGYLMQDGGFNFERTSTVKSLGFGLRSEFNSLTPERLHFVYGRAGLQYHLNRHVFSGSVGVQRLYGAQGHLVIHTQDQLQGTSSSDSKYTWLNTNGLRRWHWNAGVSYGYRLAPRLYAQAGTSFYFSSIVAEDKALAENGYYWKGSSASVQPFLTLNYLLYEVF